MSIRAIDVKPLKNYELEVVFENGEIKKFDVKPYLQYKAFQKIKNIEMFNTVKIGGLSIEWADGTDICPDELYNNSRIVFHRVKEVTPLEDMLLKIKFVNNETKVYDVKPIIKKWKVFSELKDNELFEKVKVDQGGYGISWNDNIDLACDELWENSSFMEEISRNL